MLSDKDPEEIITVTFDFTALGETVSSAAVSIKLAAGGSDATASTMLLSAPALDASKVNQRVQGGKAGSSYELRCKATMASGLVYVLPAILPVKRA